MDFGWLETFIAVAHLGTLTAATEARSLTQSGISRQLQRLEAEVGVTLVERGGRAVRLTPAGERFLAYAEATLEQHQSIIRDLRGQEAVLSGRLRIAASSTPGEFLVPELVAAFVKQHPSVCPEVMVTDSAMVEEEVRAHRWDVGFVGARLNQRGLIYRPVIDDEVVLAVPADHPFAKRGSVALAELADQPFIAREGGSGTTASVERQLAARGLRLPEQRTVMVLGSTQAIVSAVERGIGIGWVSSLALEERGSARVVAVRLDRLPLYRVLSLVYDPQRTLPPAAAAFIVSTVGEESSRRDRSLEHGSEAGETDDGSSLGRFGD